MALLDSTARAPDADRLLDNPVWWSLTGAQRHLAERNGRAARYRRDVSVFSAAEELGDESWSDLARLTGPTGEIGLLRAEIPPPPAEWTETLRGSGQQMVVGPGGLNDVHPFEFRDLVDDHIPQMLTLVDLAIPGPFLTRTIDTGRYVGHFADDELVAMAGERFRPDGFTEVSAVCTHPDHRGRGLGSSITHYLASGILGRGDQPFLHVADTNDTARRMYESLGWVSRRSMDFVALRVPG